MVELLNKKIGHSYPEAAIRVRERRAFFLASFCSFLQWISVDALVEDEFEKPLLELKWFVALVYLREGILRWLQWVNEWIDY